MVAGRPLDIVHMAAHEMRGDAFQPLVVIEQAEVVFELDVAEIMPVADPRVVGEVVLQSRHLAFGGHVLKVRARLNGQPDAEGGGPRGDRGNGIQRPLKVEWPDFLAFPDKLELGLDVFRLGLAALGHHRGEALAPLARVERHRAHVEHQVLCFELGGQFQGTECQIEGALPFEWPVRGEFIGIRRINHDLHRRGEKIVDAGAGEDSALERLADARHLRHAHAVG